MQSTIQLLHEDLASLKSKAPKAMESDTHVAWLDPDPGTDTNSHNTAQQRVRTSLTNPGIFSDRKFNLVIQGIPECSSDMKSLERLQSDLTNILKELSNLNSSKGPDCVKDTFRLGKYKSDLNRPRPILVKFLCSGDIQSILSNKKLLKS